ncbi:hypothetical protein GCM10022224_054770 [Nonomuraea antimicrobica]|uniref:Lipoprotein LprG n=1 Tax=Nonomuraea antimicrobica TaxID=561173 RepID=A0ABP7C9Z5_9ACTN
MKRTIVGVAVVAGMVQLSAAPAHAALTSDPVKALQSQLARGKAVNLTATAKVTYAAGLVATSALDGTVGFGPRGPVASDLGQTLQYSEKLLGQLKKSSPEETEALQEGPIRMVSSGGLSYVSGPVVDQALIQGESWVRYRKVILPPSNLVVEALDPATLKTLIAARTSWSGGILKGSVKAGKLAKASAPFAAFYGKSFTAKRDGKITYTLWFGEKGLVERVSAKASLPIQNRTVHVESDTRYADWGREVTVQLPLEGDAIDQSEVKDRVPGKMPGIWN